MHLLKYKGTLVVLQVLFFSKWSQFITISQLGVIPNRIKKSKWCVIHIQQTLLEWKISFCSLKILRHPPSFALPRRKDTERAMCMYIAPNAQHTARDEARARARARGRPALTLFHFAAARVKLAARDEFPRLFRCAVLWCAWWPRRRSILSFSRKTPVASATARIHDGRKCADLGRLGLTFSAGFFRLVFRLDSIAVGVGRMVLSRRCYNRIGVQWWGE